MTDQRPQYGEIATLDEQRRAAGLPPLEAERAVPIEPPLAAPAPEPRRSKPADRFITIALLAYGLFNVVVTAASYLDYSTAIDTVMGTLGVEGEFTNFAQGKIWGTVAALSLIIGWSLTAAAAIRRLRRGRVSWWVPIVGAVITVFVASVCAAIPLMGDPAFVAFVSQMSAE